MSDQKSAWKPQNRFWSSCVISAGEIAYANELSFLSVNDPQDKSFFELRFKFLGRLPYSLHIEFFLVRFSINISMLPFKYPENRAGAGIFNRPDFRKVFEP